MMSAGRIFAFNSRIAARPASKQSFDLSSDTAVCAELLGRLMPSVSIADAIVLAVYMPLQEPGPGMAARSIASTSRWLIFFCARAPTASNTVTISTFLPLWLPGRMVPPYTKTEGRLRRAMPIRQAGMFLSQPPIVTSASNPWQAATASIESAIISRETREYFIPSVPIEMPSETVIVLNTTALAPAASAPSAARDASRSMCMLHGVTRLQVEATPICGFLKSASLKPTARNIERLGARSIPSTTREEKFRMAGWSALVFFAGIMDLFRLG